MRTNKTIKNLETLWKQLDDALGALDNASHAIFTMSEMDNIKEKIERVDFSRLVLIKNEIEELIEAKEVRKQSE